MYLNLEHLPCGNLQNHLQNIREHQNLPINRGPPILREHLNRSPMFTSQTQDGTHLRNLRNLQYLQTLYFTSRTVQYIQNLQNLPVLCKPRNLEPKVWTSRTALARPGHPRTYNVEISTAAWQHANARSRLWPGESKLHQHFSHGSQWQMVLDPFLK